MNYKCKIFHNKVVINENGLLYFAALCYFNSIFHPEKYS